MNVETVFGIDNGIIFSSFDGLSGQLFSICCVMFSACPSLQELASFQDRFFYLENLQAF